MTTMNSPYPPHHNLVIPNAVRPSQLQDYFATPNGVGASTGVTGLTASVDAPGTPLDAGLGTPAESIVPALLLYAGWC